MKVIVQYSGGACSFWCLDRAIKRHGKENVVALFADVKMECDDLHRFNRDVERVLGIGIVDIADGRSPWQVFRDQRMIGNTRADMCSRILKRDLLKADIFSHYDKDNDYIYFGMDFTEQDRLTRMRRRYKPFRVDAPMLWEPLWDKDRMVAELKNTYGIEPPKLYGEGFPHNNCGGFCIKAGQAHFAHLLKMRPETYAYHEQQEQAMRDYLGKDVAILRDRRGGKTKPMTLKAFRERIATGDYDKHEWGGCGCATT